MTGDRVTVTSGERPPQLPRGAVARTWAPLAATWLMMAAEGPFVAAVIARLPDATRNLAAFGVTLSIAMLIEAPVIMMLSAATALARDADAFRRLRRFAWTLNAAVTAVMVILLVPPVFRGLTEGLIGLPRDVAELTALGTAVMLPWPAAIGYRRFYQGVLIRHGAARRVAYGTVVRLGSMAVTAVALAFVGVPGVVAGAGALAVGVTLEALASRLMAARVTAVLLDRPPDAAAERLTTREIGRFYLPLALTSLLNLGAQPLATFFVGRSRQALASLAVLPVINALVFIHRSPGLAFQEVAIALLGETGDAYRRLARFARSLALVASAILAAVAFTPLSAVWFVGVSGLKPDLAGMAVLPLRLLVAMPALEALLSFQRAMLVHARRTRSITAATAVEVAGIAVVLAIAVGPLGMVGAVAAATAVLAGRLGANLLLVGSTAPVRRSLRERRTAAAS